MRGLAVALLIMTAGAAQAEVKLSAMDRVCLVPCDPEADASCTNWAKIERTSVAISDRAGTYWSPLISVVAENVAVPYFVSEEDQYAEVGLDFSF
jgi:hypothetical protein